MTLRINIDRDLCAGYANCLEAAPDVFDLDEHDIAIVIADAGDLERYRNAIERAVKVCPRKAISLLEQ